MRIACLTACLILASATLSQAQVSRRSYYYNPIRILDNEYLQKDLKLSKEQLERIRQIKLQFAGAKALHDKEFQKELGLSEGQIKKINGIYDDYDKRRRKVFDLFRTKRDEARKKYDELRKEYNTLDDKAAEVLTRTQKARWEKLKGDKFDKDQLLPEYYRKKKQEQKKKKPDV